eukprot:m.231466 g.231466  ORF g.231466 m.231466 type:complete len:364 (+) comp18370_c0_seq1:22-1113(+)
MDVREFLRPDLRDLVYHGVESLDSIAAEIGMDVSQLVKLNANENVYGPHPKVQESLKQAELHFYPDPAQTKLRAALAAQHGVASENIVAGAGSDDILDVLVRVTGPKKIIISTPTFGMYSFLGKLSSAAIVDVPRTPSFDVDVPALCAAVREHKAELVFLPSPNNPTGNVLSLAEIATILEERCILALDEAYIDFGGETAVPLLAKHPNLMVLRTFSKWAGLAGLRLGYGIGHAALVACMLAAKQPYNVNCAAELAGLGALEHRAEIQVTVDALRREKDRLFTELQTVSWLRPLPSHANFVLCEVVGRDAKAVYGALRRRGIIIRYFGSQGGNLQNYIRISSGKPEQIDAVIRALSEIDVVGL